MNAKMIMAKVTRPMDRQMMFLSCQTHRQAYEAAGYELRAPLPKSPTVGTQRLSDFGVFLKTRLLTMGKNEDGGICKVLGCQSRCKKPIAKLRHITELQHQEFELCLTHALPLHMNSDDCLKEFVITFTWECQTSRCVRGAEYVVKDRVGGLLLARCETHLANKEKLRDQQFLVVYELIRVDPQHVQIQEVSAVPVSDFAEKTGRKRGLGDKQHRNPRPLLAKSLGGIIQSTGTMTLEGLPAHHGYNQPGQRHFTEECPNCNQFVDAMELADTGIRRQCSLGGPDFQQYAQPGALELCFHCAENLAEPGQLVYHAQ